MPYVSGQKIAYVDLNKIEKQLGIAPKEAQKDKNVKKLGPFTKLINKIFKNFSKLFSKKINKNRIIKDLSYEFNQVYEILADELEKPNTLESAEIRRNLLEGILDRTNRIRKVFREIKIIPKHLAEKFVQFRSKIIECIDEDKEAILRFRTERKEKYEQVIKMGKELDNELEEVSGLKQSIDLGKAKSALKKCDEIGQRLSKFGKLGKPIIEGKRFENAMNSVVDKHNELKEKIKEKINNAIQIMESKNEQTKNEKIKYNARNAELFEENLLLSLSTDEKNLKIEEFKKKSGNKDIIKKLEQKWKTRQRYITNNKNKIINNDKKILGYLDPRLQKNKKDISSYKKLL